MWFLADIDVIHGHSQTKTAYSVKLHINEKQGAAD